MRFIPPQTRPGKRLALGVLASVGLAVALTVAAAMATPLPGDVAVARALQWWRAPWLDGLMRGVSFVGDDPLAIGGVLAVAGVLAILRRRPEAAAFLGVLAFDLALRLPKALVDRPRPAEDVVRVLESGTSGSFPSGHAFHAVLFWGLAIAIVVPRIRSAALRRIATAGILALIAATAFSRIYLGAHWPTDVLGAAAYGVVALAALVYAHRLLKAKKGE
ncbi:MAG: phosphatase PAP2 family protein [Chloroflexi bacterium]|nr:phosphatase PAP2 family protein [Chloroflexota bacterium]